MLKQFIFGAGLYARNLIAHLMLKNEKIDGLIVTDTEANPQNVMGVEVFSKYKIFALKEDICVYVGVSESYKDEVIQELRSIGTVHINYECPTPIQKKYYHYVTDERFLSVWYLYHTDKYLAWNNLKTYNEKIQWLKLYDNSSIRTKLSDKYLVREYVANAIGDKYLIPLYGVWNNFHDIDFDTLPNDFVLKCNHGSGYNIIVNNKKMLNLNKAEEKFNEWMENDFSDFGMELQYKHIERKIIAEKFLHNKDNEDLMDYKFFVFDGTVRYIQVDIDRFKNHRRNLFTREWQYIPYSIGFPNAPEVKLPKPQKIEEMLSIAENLGKNFLHVRVDLYLFEENIYFGELTFTHGSGTEKFTPEEFGVEMGKWICTERNT